MDELTLKDKFILRQAEREAEAIRKTALRQQYNDICAKLKNPKWLASHDEWDKTKLRKRKKQIEKEIK